MPKSIKISFIFFLAVLLVCQTVPFVLAQPSYDQQAGAYSDDFSDTSGISSLDDTEHNASATRVELAPVANNFSEDFTTETYKDTTDTTAYWSTGLVKLIQDNAWATAVDYGAGVMPVAITNADFDGDGDIDLAAANAPISAGPHDISVLLGNGNGTFGSAVTYDVGSNPQGITNANFNGDSNIDLAVTNSGDNNVTILLGNGDGTFTEETLESPISVGTSPYAITSGYFNSDSNIDLAVTNYISNNVSILLGDGDGTFTAAASPGAGSRPGAIISGYFNSDSNIDLAVANLSSHDINILLGNGDGTFTEETLESPISVGTSPDAITNADFNADGKIDLAVANRGSNNVSILLGNGDGTFTAASESPVSVGNWPFSVTNADFNVDGKVDLGVANSNDGTVSVLLGDGDGTFGSAANYNVGTSPYAITKADFNGDNKIDLATANAGSNNTSILLNTSTYQSSNIAQSTNSNTTGFGIAKATLSATEQLNGQTIDYYLSADGGTNWEAVTPGVEYNFSNPGSDLRWKAMLSTPDPSQTPEINNLSIDFSYYDPVISGQVISLPITPSQVGDWDKLDIDQTLNGEDIYYQVLDRNGNLLPDSELPGNSSGLRPSSSIDISSIDASKYSSLVLKAVFSTTDSTKTPTINSYSVSWIAARIRLEKTEYSVDEEIFFNGRGSIGTNLSYFWEFGDESTAQGATAYHRYEKPGDYTAALTVTKGTHTAFHEGSVTIKILPGKPASITLFADPENPLADGKSQSTITAEVKDQYENLVSDGTEVLFEIISGSGSLSSDKALTENGKAKVTYISSEEPGTVKIKASSEGISGEVELTLVKSLLSLTKSIRVTKEGELGPLLKSFLVFPNWLLALAFVFLLVLVISKKKTLKPYTTFVIITVIFGLAFVASYSLVSARLYLTFQDQGKEVKPQDVLTYKIEYKNLGDQEAEEVEIIDPIPQGTSYLSSLNLNGRSKTNSLDQDEADFNRSHLNAVTFNLGTIKKGSSGYLTFKVRVSSLNEVDKIDNQAQLNYNPGQHTTSSNLVSNPAKEK